MEGLIFLDTHVVVWLYAGDPELFPPEIRQDLEESELLVSPIVSLELQYLREIDRISVGAGQVIQELQRTIGLRISDTPFAQVVSQALLNTWTRDPFDRIITAQAALGEDRLLTKDRMIRDHYQRAYWT
jgi:PIN domain nuclease of toxin-antitoxin system